MVVAPDGTVAGSVSGGCVEAAVYELANEVVADRAARAAALRDHPTTTRSPSASPAAGSSTSSPNRCPATRFPSCRPSPTTSPRTARPQSPPSSPIPTRVGSGAGWSSAPYAVEGSLGSARADDAVADDARGLLAAGRTAVLSYGPDGQRQDAGMEVFVASHAPRPRMLIFGAIDFAAALARQGAFLGYRVTVCDARPVFATPARFPDADEVVVDWPDRYLAAQAEQGAIDARTAICVLTHDPKFDVPLLRGGAAAARGRLHRRDGVAAHPRRPAGPAARGRADRRRAGPAGQPDRPRPRRPHPRGDRGVDRRGDHRAPLGRRRPAVDRGRRPHPPRSIR